MAIATRANSAIEPSITQDSLINGIRDALYSLNFQPHHETEEGSNKILFLVAYADIESNYGFSFLKVKITPTLVISCQFFGLWDYGNSTASLPSAEVVYSALSSGATVNVTTLSAQNELLFILLQQGNIFIPIGYLVPAVRPDWWSTGTFNYGFIPTNNTFSGWRTAGKQPFSSTDHDSFIGSSRLSGVNPVTNKRDILQGICLFSTANQGISGRTSDDLVIVAASGSARYDIIRTPDNREYLILNPAAGGFAVRVA